MGVLNCTNDSFYESSRSLLLPELEVKIDQLILEGADIIDIGGQSTKPGAIQISPDLEIERIKGALEYIKSNYPNQWCSIDTTSAQVAQYAVTNGVEIVNDVSAGNLDTSMLDLVARLGVPYVAMHMQGRPENMQDAPFYTNVTKEIISFFEEKIKLFKEKGIKQVILDPGFGFGKTIAHNYQLMAELDQFMGLNFPILVGVSRKSMIYKLLDCTASEALNGTVALNTFALLKGASILRVHDVKAAKEVVKIVEKLNNPK
jgi:dihydropteroate synthase